MLRHFSFHRRMQPFVLLAALVVSIVLALAGTAFMISARSTGRPASAPQAPLQVCHGATCTFPLRVNPGLLSGSFACPAIQHAQARITITNRFVTGAQNDVMTLTANGLPKNTAFDLFLVQNSPLDQGFSGFGFGWYQSDVQSNSGGNASVKVQGIFDKETFIENPGNPFAPIHTFNVGFWFNSPTDEQRVCNNATAPAKTPFNGEQNAGLLAMITQGGPLQTVA